MSCEISVVANIDEIDKIRKILFPLDAYNGSDSWLQSCKVSISSAGDLIVIGYERTVVVLTPKWDQHMSINSFQISHKGLIHDYDKVKAILCLTVSGKSDNSQLGCDWSCIIIGFDSGYVRCYTDTCDLLFEEQFHAENIITITCKASFNAKHTYQHPEEIYIQYQSVICTLNGKQLVSILKNCQNNVTPSNQDLVSLMPKKWGFQEQSQINASAVVCLNTANTFDHLLTASTCGGFNAKYRSVPPNNTLVLAAGSKPFLGYHYALEGGGQPILSDVAKAVASKLKSTLPTWLVGNKNLQEKPVLFASHPADAMGCRFGLCDLRRVATDIILSPDNKLAAICDTLGRILIVDSLKGVVIKMFKGYREGQCSFIQVPDEKRSKSRTENKIAHFLVIYSPKKGTIEVFSIQQGVRIATFSASKHSRLLYVSYGIEGISTTLKSRHSRYCTSLFIDNNGLIKEFLIPFHFILSEKNNTKARDLHLYKKIRHLIKTADLSNEKVLNEALNICTEIKTNDIKYQITEFLLDNKNLSPEFILNCCKFFLENLDGENSTHLKTLCENASAILNLYIFTSHTRNETITSDEVTEYTFNGEVKEMINLRKLLSLCTDKDTINLSEPRVRFSDNLDFTVSKFISIFNCTDANVTSLKPNVDESLLYKVSESIFKPYLDGTAVDYSTLQTQLKESKIPTKNLFDLLLSYWVNRPLDVALNLEVDMKKLFILLNIIVKMSNGEIDDIHYNEVSKFWSNIRNVLIDSPRPFPALMAAILCKNVQNYGKKADLDESSTSLNDMEVLTQEDIEWGLVIGKLEDISLLNIILATKPVADDCPLPKLNFNKVDISLKNILQRGRGSVSELVAQWITSIGFNPEKLVLHEEDSESQDNKMLFESFNLLKEQFPYSLEVNCLLTNMSWEYATVWQKEMHDLSLLSASVTCLNCVQNLQIKQGLYQLLWNTHLKIVNENASKLINKVGKLPKERLCKQDTGLTDYQLSLFLSISTDFLDSFMETVKSSYNVPKEIIKFENIWDNGGTPLVELAMQQRDVNFELLFLHYQLSLVLLMTTTFTIKQTKPVNNLFDASIINLFFTDLQKKLEVYSNKSDIRLNSNRMNFLFKIITASMDSITLNESGKTYSSDHVYWMSKCLSLGKIWNLDVDSLRRYQIAQLFMRGFDSVAEELIPTVNETQELGKSLLEVAARRLSQFLVASPQLSENISALTPSLTKYMQSLDEEWCSPCSISNITNLSTHVLHCLKEEDGEYKLASVLLDACKTLEEIQS